jgi:hypothetical protein
MDTTRIGERRMRRPAGRPRRSGRERLVVVVALVGAALLLAVPRLLDATVAIGSDLETGVGAELATGEAFEATFSIDTESRSISSNVPSIGRVDGNVRRLDFTVVGWSGEGLVAITATGPDGEILIDDLVGPESPYQYPPDAGTPSGWLLVKTSTNQVTLPHPSSELILAIFGTNPTPTPLTVTEIGVYDMDSGRVVWDLDSGRPDSCALLETPISMLRRATVACTVAITFTGPIDEPTSFEAQIETDRGMWGVVVGVQFDPAVEPPSQPGPVSGSPGEDTPPPVTTGIFTDDPGAYQITFASDGSRGFDLSIYGQYTTIVWPWQDSFVPVVLGGGFLLVMVLGLWTTWGEHQHRERFLGSALLVAGLSVPLLLLLTRDHGWYWKPVTHLIWLVALAAIAVGSYLAASARGRVKPIGWPRRLLSLAFYLVVGFVVVVTAAASWVYGGGVLGLLGGEWSGSDYSGDYLNMGLHVMGFWASAILLALAGLVAGRNRVMRPALSDRA